MKVKAIWEFDVDVEGLDPEQIDIPGVAKDVTRCELACLLKKQDIVADDFTYSIDDDDFVNHAEWIVKVSRFTSDSENVHVHNRCSCCDGLDKVDILPRAIWDAGWQASYKPKLSNYCRDCGSKMDLRELYEQYKRDWCDARGYKLEDMDEEVGINGECYTCFDEWYNNEYKVLKGE